MSHWEGRYRADEDGSLLTISETQPVGFVLFRAVLNRHGHRRLDYAFPFRPAYPHTNVKAKNGLPLVIHDGALMLVHVCPYPSKEPDVCAGPVAQATRKKGIRSAIQFTRLPCE